MTGIAYRIDGRLSEPALFLVLAAGRIDAGTHAHLETVDARKRVPYRETSEGQPLSCLAVLTSPLAHHRRQGRKAVEAAADDIRYPPRQAPQERRRRGLRKDLAGRSIRCAAHGET